MTPETAALALAGAVLPFVQEKLAGAHIDGLAAFVANLLACVILAAAATLLFGGTADAGTMLAKIGGVFILAQTVYQSVIVHTEPAP